VDVQNSPDSAVEINPAALGSRSEEYAGTNFQNRSRLTETIGLNESLKAHPVANHEFHEVTPTASLDSNQYLPVDLGCQPIELALDVLN
jgi:hypothetical protein